MSSCRQLLPLSAGAIVSQPRQTRLIASSLYSLSPPSSLSSLLPFPIPPSFYPFSTLQTLLQASSCFRSILKGTSIALLITHNMYFNSYFCLLSPVLFLSFDPSVPICLCSLHYFPSPFLCSFSVRGRLRYYLLPLTPLSHCCWFSPPSDSSLPLLLVLSSL